MFKVGDKVVYPHHGAGTVVKKEQREVLGQKREYLTIKILHNDMTVNVPCENAEKVGLRRVIDEVMVEKVLKALQGSGTTMPKNWNRRFKHNRDKMKTGDIFELAEVVRNLSLRDHEKGLSTGEKQMFVKAKKILASELMYAKAMDEDEAGIWLDEVLSTVCGRQEANPQGRRRSERLRPEHCVSAWAVLAAAGSGERLGADRPKAFAPLRGRPLLAESLARLDASDWVDSVVVVAPPGWEEPAILLAEELGCGKVAASVTGGATRAESVRLGVAEVGEDAAVVLVHDAARPLVTDAVIERLLGALGEGWDGAIPGLPVVDTVKRVEGAAVVETLPRASLVTVQTPQAFVADLFCERRSRAGRGNRLLGARRGRGRARRRRPRRPAAPEGDDAGGPRARGVVAGGGACGVIVDYHMHLRDPEEEVGFTVAAIERFVEVAAARGVDEIGFTEHVYYFVQTRDVWSLPYQLTGACTTSTPTSAQWSRRSGRACP